MEKNTHEERHHFFRLIFFAGLCNVHMHKKTALTCNGTIMQSIMAVVNVFIRVSTALCRKQTRVKAVPISLDAPTGKRKNTNPIRNSLNTSIQSVSPFDELNIVLADSHHASQSYRWVAFDLIKFIQISNLKTKEKRQQRKSHNAASVATERRRQLCHL